MRWTVDQESRAMQALPVGFLYHRVSGAYLFPVEHLEKDSLAAKATG